MTQLERLRGFLKAGRPYMEIARALHVLGRRLAATLVDCRDSSLRRTLLRDHPHLENALDELDLDQGALVYECHALSRRWGKEGTNLPRHELEVLIERIEAHEQRAQSLLVTHFYRDVGGSG